MLASARAGDKCAPARPERLSTDSMPAAEAADSAQGNATMKRTAFLPLAASMAVLLAGCVTSGYQYREGNGDYYYGQPSVEYNDYGYGSYGYGGYGYPGGWSGSLGFGYGYGGYGYPYGGYGYPYGGYGYPWYPPLILVPGHHHGGHHHGGHDQPDPVPYRPDRPHRIGGDGTTNTPIMMPSAPRSRIEAPRIDGPRIMAPRLSEPSRPRPLLVPPPAPRADRDGFMAPADRPMARPRIQLPERSARDRDGRRSSTP